MALRSNHLFDAFVLEITEALLAGQLHRTPGLGTFSTCTRRATQDRPSSKMAMFRASPELRQFANGGPPPRLSGVHADAAMLIVRGMRLKAGIHIPLLGRMAIVPVQNAKPKIIFHGAKELNDLLGASR